MKALTDKHLRYFFYLFWIVTLIPQSLLIGLSGDEAYYWRYSKQLAWGYFDHPPVVAVLVRMGYALFNNELGVRLFFVITVIALVMALERLVRPVNLKLFYLI